MKKLLSIIKKNSYTISFSDKSGNWTGGHKRGGYIIIKGNGWEKEFCTISEALIYLK